MLFTSFKLGFKEVYHTAIHFEVDPNLRPVESSKCRTRVAALFPNEVSLLLRTTALLCEQSDEWSIAKFTSK